MTACREAVAGSLGKCWGAAMAAGRACRMQTCNGGWAGERMQAIMRRVHYGFAQRAPCSGTMAGVRLIPVKVAGERCVATAHSRIHAFTHSRRLESLNAWALGPGKPHGQRLC